jgi:hypothetical protein
MKTLRLLFLIAAALVVGALLLGVIGCKEDPPESLFDPTYVSSARPVVTGVSPASPGLAGVTTLTFTGSNFSATASENLVFFDASVGTVLGATPTQLRVLVPKLVKDTILIKIAVKGATLFSDPPIQYKLEPPFVDYGKWKTVDQTFGVAVDAAGVVYASTLSKAVGIGVQRYNGDGTRSEYSPRLSSTVPLWNSMKFGTGGYLYVCARNILWRIPPGGGAAATYQTVTGATSATDIDFDANSNIWVAGIGNSNIYRVRTADKNVKPFACRGDMRAVKVYAGYVYVGGKRDSLEKVFRFPIITADSLGAEEEYFNLTSVFGVNGGGIFAMTFNTDGDLYIGTDHVDGIRLVHADKTSERMYPGILLPKNISFAWGISGPSLYVSRTGGILADGSTVPDALLSINTQKTGAPTYGR